MKRTTIFVPESLERDLQLLASRERRATAAVVREALAEYVAKRQPARALPSFVGAFASGQTDTAERHEDLLFAKLSPHEDMKPPSNRTPAATRKRSKSKPRRSRS
jgi:predicted transcriptional regulator